MKIVALTRSVAAIFTLLAAVPCAIAETYPSRVVKIIVGHAAGSSPDVIARVVANRLSQRLKQSFIVENRVGANGSLAAEQASRAAPDGYTLLLAGSSVIATNPFLYPKTSEAILGLTPLTNVTSLDFLLAVRASLGPGSFSELVAYIKANPGRLNLATTNIGSFQNLGAELLKQQGGLDFTTVPFNGGAAATAAVAGGHADMLIDAAAIIRPLARSGALKIVATTGAARDPAMRDVPTIAESGFPGYRVLGWVGMMAPSGTPGDILMLLHANVAAALREDAVRAQLTAMGFTPIANTPAEFRKELEHERETWKGVIAKLGITLD